MPQFNPPVRDPAFLRWLENLLRSGYGLQPEPCEIIGQLEGETGFSAQEICSELGYPEGYYDEPVEG